MGLGNDIGWYELQLEKLKEKLAGDKRYFESSHQSIIVLSKEALKSYDIIDLSHSTILIESDDFTPEQMVAMVSEYIKAGER